MLQTIAPNANKRDLIAVAHYLHRAAIEDYYELVMAEASSMNKDEWSYVVGRVMMLLATEDRADYHMSRFLSKLAVAT